MAIQLILQIINNLEDIHQKEPLLKIKKVMIMSGEKKTYVSLIPINGGLIHQKVTL